jgi:hypothetical protein
MPKDHSRDLLKQTKLGLTQIQAFWKYPSDHICILGGIHTGSQKLEMQTNKWLQM